MKDVNTYSFHPTFQPMNEKSESLLTQILETVVTTQAQVTTISGRLDAVDVELRDQRKQLESLSADAFPAGDPVAHRRWHETNSIPKWRRWVIKLVS